MPMQGIPLTSLAAARAFSHTAAWSITCRCPSPLLCASTPASCGAAACSCPSLTCVLTATVSWQHGTRCAVPALSLNAASAAVISDSAMLVSIAFSVRQRTSFVWGGCMLLPLADLRSDRHGIMAVWNRVRSATNDSTDLTMTPDSSICERSLVPQ